MKSLMCALGCNVFAGGLSVGVGRHFNVTTHLEHDGYGAEVVRLNQPGVRIYDRKANWPEPAFEREAELQRAADGGEPDGGEWPSLKHLQRQNFRFIFANPPCAPFSVAAGARAAHTSWDKDPRIQRTHDVFSLLQIRPDVLATESVCAGWTKGEPMWREYAAQAGRQGYATTVVLHDAQYLRVPQRRARVFFVFHKVPLLMREPDWEGVITVRQALKGLKITAAEKKRYPRVQPPMYQHLVQRAKPGERLVHVYNKLNPNPKISRLGQAVGRPGFLISRIPWDKPSTVVLGGDVMYHPEEPRLLYPSEVARLATFPDDFQWPEGYALGVVTGWMSRGVAPKVGEWLAASVRDSIEDGGRIRKPFMAVHDLRRAPGSYEVIS